jgi:lipopolysaccharide transport system ATP-binding protein
VSDPIICVENLGKHYRLGRATQGQYDTLRDSLTQWSKWVYQSFRPRRKTVHAARRQEFWALQDISFQIYPGEVVGVIGRNGAGKSTLLKLLSQITEPSTGRMIIEGQIASLLEVGTGFHPELTGRENIYLNGAILGMSRAEIKAKFDEIVAFSEVESFLDTPVKRYSSGMQVRLAFAVAAHLEPEILIIDEVLAVGDAAFQEKCLGKMGNVANQDGRTILFVSHNMAAVQALCPRTLWLNAGRLVDQGPTRQVIQNYLQSVFVQAETSLEQRSDRGGDGSIRLRSVRIESLDADGAIHSSSRLKISIWYHSSTQVLYPNFVVSVYDYLSNRGIFRLDSHGICGLPNVLPPEGCVICTTDSVRLTAGRCYVNLRIKKGAADADYIQYAAFFDVEADTIDGTHEFPERSWMLTLIQHQWSTGRDD